MSATRAEILADYKPAAGDRLRSWTLNREPFTTPDDLERLIFIINDVTYLMDTWQALAIAEALTSSVRAIEADDERMMKAKA